MKIHKVVYKDWAKEKKTRLKWQNKTKEIKSEADASSHGLVKGIVIEHI